jgi:hypothetical protein
MLLVMWQTLQRGNHLDLAVCKTNVSRRGFLAWMQLSHSCRFCVVTIGKFEDLAGIVGLIAGAVPQDVLIAQLRADLCSDVG